jgi:hypothetical protein
VYCQIGTQNLCPKYLGSLKVWNALNRKGVVDRHDIAPYELRSIRFATGRTEQYLGQVSNIGSQELRVMIAEVALWDTLYFTEDYPTRYYTR